MPRLAPLATDRDRGCSAGGRLLAGASRAAEFAERGAPGRQFARRAGRRSTRQRDGFDPPQSVPGGLQHRLRKGRPLWSREDTLRQRAPGPGTGRQEIPARAPLRVSQQRAIRKELPGREGARLGRRQRSGLCPFGLASATTDNKSSNTTGMSNRFDEQQVRHSGARGVGVPDQASLAGQTGSAAAGVAFGSGGCGRGTDNLSRLVVDRLLTRPGMPAGRVDVSSEGAGLLACRDRVEGRQR